MPLHNLTTLSLSNNFITAVQEGAFGRLTNLDVLDLRANALRNIEGGMFQGLGKLRLLELSRNSIREINEGTFKDLVNMETLGVNGCPVLVIEAHALYEAPKLVNFYPPINNASEVNSARKCHHDQQQKALICDPPIQCSISPVSGERLPGAEKAMCVCPTGAYYLKHKYGDNRDGDTQGGCLLCDVNTYSDTQGATACTPCEGFFYNTGQKGATSVSQCQFPTAQLIGLTVGGATFMCFAFILLVYFHDRRIRKQLLSAERNLKEVLEEQLVEQQHEISYLRDWRVAEAEITCERLLEQGSEGEVWLGQLHRAGFHNQVAIKKLLGTGKETKALWDEAEISFMINMQHPRLVKLLGAGTMANSRDPRGPPTRFTVQEYLNGGSIDKRLWETPRASVEWAERITWASDVAEAMAFIHSRGLVHRDLKASNVLYCTNTGRAKVADFGTTRPAVELSFKGPQYCEEIPKDSPLLKATENGVMMTAMGIGTPQFLAPEIASNYVTVEDNLKALKEKSACTPTHRAQIQEKMHSFRRQHDQLEYSMAVDTYAHGILMFEMLMHQKPWDGVDMSDMFRHVAAGERPHFDAHLPNTPTGWCELMQACWHQDPGQRPSFDEVHERLQGMQCVTLAQTNHKLLVEELGQLKRDKEAKCSIRPTPPSHGSNQAGVQQDKTESSQPFPRAATYAGNPQAKRPAIYEIYNSVEGEGPAPNSNMVVSI